MLSSDKFHKGYLETLFKTPTTLLRSEKRGKLFFKRSIKHYNETVMSFSTAEDVLIWMKWQMQEKLFLHFASQIFHFFMLSSLTFELRLRVTTDRWWIFLELTKRLTICLWQVSETSLWQRLWTRSLQLIHLYPWRPSPHILSLQWPQYAFWERHRHTRLLKLDYRYLWWV